jgi:hypothetical protein
VIVRATDEAARRRTSEGNDERAAPGGAATSRVPGADELRRIHTLYARALREDSNDEMDWLWLASQLSPSVERRESLEGALWINPESEFARRELAKLPPNLTSISSERNAK